jgi:hypothetical protein
MGSKVSSGTAWSRSERPDLMENLPGKLADPIVYLVNLTGGGVF